MEKKIGVVRHLGLSRSGKENHDLKGVRIRLNFFTNTHVRSNQTVLELVDDNTLIDFVVGVYGN